MRHRHTATMCWHCCLCFAAAVCNSNPHAVVRCSTLVSNLHGHNRSELDEDGLMRIFTATLAEHGVLEDYEPPRSKYAKKLAAAAKKDDGED